MEAQPQTRRNPSSRLDHVDSDEHKAQTFACPFYKNNATRSANAICRNVQMLRNIARVKQHIARCHLQPLHCARCWITFPNLGGLLAHQRASTLCVPSQQACTIEGVNEAQRRLLSKRSRNVSREDQWKDVYRILFPEVKECDIPSPYFEDPATQQSARLRENEACLPQEPPSVLSENLRRSGVHFVEDKLNDFSCDLDFSSFHSDHSPFHSDLSPFGLDILSIFEPSSTQAVPPTVACDARFPSNDPAPIPSDDASYDRELKSVDSCLSPSSTRRLSLTSEENVHGTKANTAEKLGLLGSKEDKNDDIPYTDSGYASARGPVYPSMYQENAENPNHANCIHKDSTSDMDANDANTSYSAVTAIFPELADNCVVDVCNNINSRLDGLVDRPTLVSLSKRLPELIKAFAIKLGSDMPDQINLRVMHFVHKHHQYIVSQLRNEFHCDVNEPTSLQKQMDTMPLDEIMNMWDKNDNQRPVAVDPSEYLQGVEDEDVEDQKEDISALSEYSQRIVNSAAYEWLISSLVKEATLHCDDAQPQTTMDQIRQEILTQLPTGRISSKRLPTQHTVSFRIPKSFVPFLPEDAVLPSSFHSQTAIADRIVATSLSDDSIQLLKVSEYMDQTWPLGGGTLLSVLQSVINGAGQARASSTLEGNGVIEIILNGSYLETFVTGTSYSIAEYGEQLAWLTAALQPAISNLGTYVRPFMRHVDSYTTPTEKRHSWVIELVKEQIDDTDSTACSVQEWQNEPKTPVIVQGFPILSRPGNCPGIEVPWQLPISLAPSLICMGKANRFLLTATGKVLHLFAQTQGVTIWHILSSPREDCTCHQRFLKTDDKRPLSSPDLVRIWQGRHIITACSTAELYNKGQEPGLDPKKESAEVQRRKDSLSGATRPSPCTSSTADCSDSLDVDMLSIPDVSEDSVIGSQDSDDATSSIMAVVATRLISEYQSYTKWSPANECASNTKQCSPGQQQSCKTQGSTQSTRGEGTTQANSIESTRKRPMGQNDRNSDDDDSYPPPKRQKSKHHDSGKSLQIFACPFWKQNPGKHHNCFGKSLDDICRIKQHLARSHTPKFYCGKCLEVFPDTTNQLTHLRYAECSFQDNRFEFITSEKQSELSRKRRSGLNKSQQWFVVWDILFPGLCRPSSPYLDLGISPDFNHFLEFYESRGTTVAIEILRDRGILASGGGENDEEVQRTLNHVIHAILREWRFDWDSLSQNTTSEGSSSAEAPRQQQHNGRRRVRMPVLTDPSSNADSGIELGSQPSSGPSREDANLPPYVPIQPRPPLGSRLNMDSTETANLGVQAAGIPSIDASPLQVFVEPSSLNVAQFDHLHQNRGNRSEPEPLDFDIGEEWPGVFGDDFDTNSFFASFDNGHLGSS
ncbi:hypothetical protein PFICI_09980 [Pestalotiopsis fici W106-1]|uniref:C2H2-type domain-containing protein n=1 Tax=Pestalotiopsis fici (strain W106-1 / CGMCC3.15140) TaxID=1229662 RepID=W3WVL9_PESFW|nr:uncharacterized protein PFICI_09980 [Pestalotiopsis fici W106-1]ETS77918.1 hypothetical protein PFICI_09980 [Pestalotiopsis fici W106-1]